MFNSTIFPFKKVSFLAATVMGMCLWTGESLAQEEQDKVEIEPLKSVDRPIRGDHAASQEVIIPKVVVTPKSKTLPTQSTPIRREVVLGQEGKKSTEPVSSTLSFNIFLYVVDKFKAD